MKLRILTKIILLSTALNNVYSSTSNDGIDEKAIEDSYKTQVDEDKSRENQTTTLVNGIDSFKRDTPTAITTQSPVQPQAEAQVQVPVPVPVQTQQPEQKGLLSRLNPFISRNILNTESTEKGAFLSGLNPFRSSNINNPATPIATQQQQQQSPIQQQNPPQKRSLFSQLNSLGESQKPSPLQIGLGIAGVGAALTLANAVSDKISRDRDNEFHYGQDYPPGQYAPYTQTQMPYVHPHMEYEHTQMPDVQSQVPYAQSQMLNAQTQMPYAQSQTLYAHPQMPYAQTQMPYVQSQILHAHPQMPYAQTQMSYAQTQTPYAHPQMQPGIQVRPYASANEVMQDIQAAVSAQMPSSPYVVDNNYYFKNSNAFVPPPLAVAPVSSGPPFNPLNPRQPYAKSTDQVIYEISKRKGSFSFPQIFLTNYDEGVLPPPRGLAPIKRT